MESAARSSVGKKLEEFMRELMASAGLTEREVLCLYIGSMKSLTALGAPEDLAMSIAAGMFEHLSEAEGNENLQEVLREGAELLDRGVQ